MTWVDMELFIDCILLLNANFMELAAY